MQDFLMAGEFLRHRPRWMAKHPPPVAHWPTLEGRRFVYVAAVPFLALWFQRVEFDYIGIYRTRMIYHGGWERQPPSQDAIVAFMKFKAGNPVPKHVVSLSCCDDCNLLGGASQDISTLQLKAKWTLPWEIIGLNPRRHTFYKQWRWYVSFTALA